jgi:hypothetical protein
MPGPSYAAAVGLLQYGVRPHHQAGLVDEAHLFGKVRRRMVGWLKAFM